MMRHTPARNTQRGTTMTDSGAQSGPDDVLNASDRAKRQARDAWYASEIERHASMDHPFEPADADEKDVEGHGHCGNCN